MKFPEKWGTNSWFFLQECCSTPDGFGQEFFSKEHCDSTGTSPYSHDVATVDFYLFPRLISEFKGRCFRDARDVVRNVVEGLKRLSQHGFQECFQHLYSRRQKCIVAQGGIFWRKCSLNGCTVLYFSEIRWFHEHFEATTSRTNLLYYSIQRRSSEVVTIL